MRDFDTTNAILEDIPNICKTCGSIGHTSGRCTTDIQHIVIGVEPATTHVDFYSSLDNWQAPEEMKKVSGRGEFELYKTFPLGEYYFKFVVNRREWRCSDRYPIVSVGGTQNNFLKVGPLVEESYIFKAVPGEAPSADAPQKYEVIILLSYISLNYILARKNIANYERVEVWGSWNNWAHGSVMNFEQRSEIPIMRATRVLEAQAYHYKFKVDGVWALDPYRKSITLEGNTNHVLDFRETLLEDAKKNIELPRDLSSPVPVEFLQNEQLSDLYLYGHTLNALAGKLYIFGGQIKETFTNTTYVFNHKTQTVRNLEMGDNEGPPAIAFHKTIVYGEKLILFGGHNEQISNEYHTYSTLNRRWTHYKIRQNPMKREHYSVVHKKNSGRLYFFGGYYCSPDDEAEKNFQDIHVLYLNVMKFTKLVVRAGAEPHPRCNHTANFHEWKMFVFGGCEIAGMNRRVFNDVCFIDLFDHEKLQWTFLTPEGAAPCPRYAHASEMLGGALFVYGGLTQAERADVFLGDLWAFDVRRHFWTRITINPPVLLERAYSAMCALDNHLFIYGGKFKPKSSSENHDKFMKITF